MYRLSLLLFLLITSLLSDDLQDIQDPLSGKEDSTTLFELLTEDSANTEEHTDSLT